MTVEPAIGFTFPHRFAKERRPLPAAAVFLLVLLLLLLVHNNNNNNNIVLINRVFPTEPPQLFLLLLLLLRRVVLFIKMMEFASVREEEELDPLPLGRPCRLRLAPITTLRVTVFV